MPVLGADYMEQFQPGLSFSPDSRAEKHRRLHGRVSRDSARAEAITR